MKIVLLGAQGQLGWELQRALAPLGELTILDRSGGGTQCGDLARPEALAQSVLALAPEVIVNAAAYTAVDRAETETAAARIINADAPAALAEAARALDAWLVHYSTDYVFDGRGERSWRESDPAAPLNVYGATKLAGEEAIRDSGCRHLIFRTSWVYAARGRNFARTLLRLAAERERLEVVDDQIGAPTGADLLADVTAHAVRAAVRQPELGGLYHVTAAGETSWYGYARFILEAAAHLGWSFRMTADNIAPVATDAHPTPARRPRNSRLDCRRFRDAFDLHLPTWQTGVARLLNELREQGHG